MVFGKGFSFLELLREECDLERFKYLVIVVFELGYVF